MSQTAAAATIPKVAHHTATLNGDELHYVTAGTDGTPVLLVHGFPESWWAFRKLIPLLASEHRIIAVDLPGFGDSGHERDDYTSSFAAESLRQLIEHLDLGPVHLTGQDIGGISTFRLAASHPSSSAVTPRSRPACPGSDWRCWPMSPTGAHGTSAFSRLPASRRCCSPDASATSWPDTPTPR